MRYAAEFFGHSKPAPCIHCRTSTRSRCRGCKRPVCGGITFFTRTKYGGLPKAPMGVVCVNGDIRMYHRAAQRDGRPCPGGRR